MAGNSLFHRQDSLAILHENRPLSDKLGYLHDLLNKRHAFIKRLAVAIYDPKTDMLKTFIHSSGDSNPLKHYQAPLSDATSLKSVVESGQPRVVNDLSIFADSDRPHSLKIREQGYRASYTMPMFRNGNFCGFIFFNASEAHVLTDEVLHDLDMVGNLLSLTIINELQQYRTLEAAIHTIRDMTHHRDAETGGHLDRMSRYARIIAQELAEKYQFTDEHIEKIFLFSPLHDIGKIAIPDNILLKPGKLAPDEFDAMKTHTTKGREIIEAMLDHFKMDGISHNQMLINIAEYHHEALNGQGYPHGLSGEAIPIEARIIAVADIFDALTSKRPYKPAWENDKAVEALQEMAGSVLDPDCVAALCNNMDRIETIQQSFKQDYYG
ncbi:MAG: HD domain-containing phosphohydrolase [Pseudomonadota bacterium]